jgi:PhzF family phenazine biosynthesis protein
VWSFATNFIWCIHMTGFPFRQVDVFTAVPFKGNPVAVVLDAGHLSAGQMQAIANWTNLSETTFVCPPEDTRADYRLRIFTPRSELRFAGHPTIGSAHAILRHGIKPKTAGRLTQECGAGLVSIRIDGTRLFLMLPKPALREISPSESELVAKALGITIDQLCARAIVDVGISWLTLQLRDATAVRSLRPDMVQISEATPRGVAGITVFGLNHPDTSQTQIEVRSFAPTEGVPEDPVCGSGNGCVAALVRREHLLSGAGYVASQGGCVGRDGRVEIQFDDTGTIWLGGNAVTCVEGTLVT